MAKRVTKNIKAFAEKGFYDLDTYEITGSKDGEVTNILEELAKLAKDGQEISITIKQEDSIDDIVDDNE